MNPRGLSLAGLKGALIRHGFYVVLLAVLLLFSLTTKNFATFANLLAMLHAMAPLVVFSCGMALVVFSGKLDISIGSIAMVSCSVAVLLMRDHGVHPVVAFLVILSAGCCSGP